jgi:hypothetical protein
MDIPHSIKTLIESGCPAHLVTLNRDGSPQVTIVWVGLDGEDLVTGHLFRNQKVKNIARDQRVAISLETATKSAMGLTEYAVLYGDGGIDAGGCQTSDGQSLGADPDDTFAWRCAACSGVADGEQHRDALGAGSRGRTIERGLAEIPAGHGDADVTRPPFRRGGHQSLQQATQQLWGAVMPAGALGGAPHAGTAWL